MISIVIPAHNEAAVIERLLRGITTNASADEIEVVVACNGCTDETVKICRDYDFPIKVCETTEASKIAGLNLGDATATGFPRCYIDADVEVDLETIRAVATALESGATLAAAPRMEVNLERSSLPVRMFYRVWLRLPYHTDGMIGSGFFAVSENGRRRFGSFPEIIADDGFVRAQFGESERKTLQSHYFKIVAPTNLWDLIRVKTRSRLGLWELGRKFPETKAREKKNWSSAARRLWLSPTTWLGGPVYLLVVLVAKFRAKRMIRRLDEYEWERDESSRSFTVMQRPQRVSR